MSSQAIPHSSIVENQDKHQVKAQDKHQVKGQVKAGFETVRDAFQAQFDRGNQHGASLCVYHRGEKVVDLYGGVKNLQSGELWQQDTRIVLFSVTKGFVAMAFHLLVDRGLCTFQDLVEDHWPGFAKNGKEGMTIGTLLSHRGGLSALDTKLSLEEYISLSKKDYVRALLENQAPVWPPGEAQGYHAITWGLYTRELFERIAKVDLGAFLHKNIFAPLKSDVFLGTPPSEDERFAELYPPQFLKRAAFMLNRRLSEPTSPEAKVFQAALNPKSTTHRALTNPSPPRNRLEDYNAPPVRHAVLAWASATGSAEGIARAYLPFASKGQFDGKTYLREETLQSAYHRLSWTEEDKVLLKPMGFSNGFMKEERHLFSPNPESFGHPGLGGALGWCDPREELTIGYTMNKMDWRVRSLRALELCHAIYDSKALTGSP